MKKIIFLVILIVLIGGGLIAYKTYDESVNYVANIEDEIKFTVAEGESFNTLLDDLETKALIKNKEVIKLYLKINDINPEVKTGEYTISNRTLSLTELIAILEKGVFKPGIKITIKEGLRSDQIADVLEEELGENSVFSKTEFLAFVNAPNLELLSADNAISLSSFKPAGLNLEGFIFPDTYEFLPEQTTVQILDTIIGNFVAKVSTEFEMANLNLPTAEVGTFYQGLVLASIVEKESSRVDRKEVISSIFHNRLVAGMWLQSDATVNYITKKNDAAVLIEDTLIESPYNTYRVGGLPPTPISNPGIVAIRAALYPDSTTYYFFFHDDSGNSYLSETYDEHLTKLAQIRGFN